MFVGSVSDNFDERIDQKIFHSEIVMDNDKISAEIKHYKKIPDTTSFFNEDNEDIMSQMIEANYKQIKKDVVYIIEKDICRTSHSKK